MLEGIIEVVIDRAPMGIISDDIDAGGLQVPDNEATDIEGESEYWRPTGTWSGPDMDNMLCGPEDDEP